MKGGIVHGEVGRRGSRDGELCNATGPGVIIRRLQKKGKGGPNVGQRQPLQKGELFQRNWAVKNPCVPERGKEADRREGGWKNRTGVVF